MHSSPSTSFHSLRSARRAGGRSETLGQNGVFGGHCLQCDSVVLALDVAGGGVYGQCKDNHIVLGQFSDNCSICVASVLPSVPDLHLY